MGFSRSRFANSSYIDTDVCTTLIQMFNIDSQISQFIIMFESDHKNPHILIVYSFSRFGWSVISRMAYISSCYIDPPPNNSIYNNPYHSIWRNKLKTQPNSKFLNITLWSQLTSHPTSKTNTQNIRVMWDQNIEV